MTEQEYLKIYGKINFDSQAINNKQEKDCDCELNKNKEQENVK